jgi:hypothetical protein
VLVDSAGAVGEETFAVLRSSHDGLEQAGRIVILLIVIGRKRQVC